MKSEERWRDGTEPSRLEVSSRIQRVVEDEDVEWVDELKLDELNDLEGD